ncbi:MAG: hypothetical protein DI628_03970 [Blastochloris viridis]|uniref:Uncharacterized protein n=1 Tax=Blastochloris viridis TaxID=1079 RepID=A0A6N4RFE3_BLAVI|nr:MAG: hypothetical protein DI628_03970 [Blastochloris viridis]
MTLLARVLAGKLLKKERPPASDLSQKQNHPLTGKCHRQTAAQGDEAFAPIEMEKMSDYDSLLDSRHHKHSIFLVNVPKTCAL